MAELGTADVGRAADAEPIGYFFLGFSPYISFHLDHSRFRTPWPIQTLTIPKILEGADVVVRALPGNGKTFTYLACILRSFRSDLSCGAPLAIIVLPTFELCKKVHKQLMELAELCEIELKVSLVKHESENLIENSDIVISTPAAVLSCLEHGLLQMESPLKKYGISMSLRFLVLDEVDLLFLPGFEDNLKSVKSIVDLIPKSSQCLVFSANPSADVKKLKGLVLHNPYVLTLTEDKYCNAEISPYNFRHFYVPCKEDEKPVYLPDFLNYTIGRVVIFTNSDEKSSRLNSLIQKEFNNENYDILIVTDNNQSAPMQPIGMKIKSESLNCDSEGVVFEDVVLVVHYDMPQDGDGYIRRILSTKTPPDRIGYSISMATSIDKDVFKEIKCSLGEDGNLNTKFVVQIPWVLYSLGDVDDECPRFSVEHVLCY